VTQALELDPASLADRIRKSVARGVLTLPPLPELATRVLQLLRAEDGADVVALSKLIEKEPAITASVLRVANSVSFAGFGAVPDLDQAIARLGARQVGSIVTAVTHKDNYVSSDPAYAQLMRRLWDHAVATALGARRLAVAGRGDAGEAFLAGLLHDAGKLVVLKGVDQLGRGKDAVQISPAVVSELMKLLHAELGYRTLTAWKLPAPICRVAERHHDPKPPLGDLLLIRVQAANAIARAIGAHPEPQQDLDLHAVPAIERLNLAEPELLALLVALEGEFNSVQMLI
jgi:HD-like signal output (HDOD) protein